jgi:hypothetical protein
LPNPPPWPPPMALDPETTISVSAESPCSSELVIVVCSPWVIESKATMAAIPITTPKVVSAALSLRSLIALKEYEKTSVTLMSIHRLRSDQAVKHLHRSLGFKG